MKDDIQYAKKMIQRADERYKEFAHELTLAQIALGRQKDDPDVKKRIIELEDIQFDIHKLGIRIGKARHNIETIGWK